MLIPLVRRHPALVLPLLSLSAGLLIAGLFVLAWSA
jgi:hypothetical protein